MSKIKIFIILGFGVVFLIILTAIFLSRGSTKTNQNIAASVPLPSEESIIMTFFNLIDEKRIPAAISMMTPTSIPDESTKQAWGVQFDAFSKISATKIEPYMKEQWSNNRHTYKVTLLVSMKPESKNAVIPYFGYADGINTRFVTVEKINSLWKISGIATGP
jgi:hypothetical protein